MCHGYLMLFAAKLSFQSSFFFFANSIGLASADVTAEGDAWKRIATGKTGSKQR